MRLLISVGGGELFSVIYRSDSGLLGSFRYILSRIIEEN